MQGERKRDSSNAGGAAGRYLAGIGAVEAFLRADLRRGGVGRGGEARPWAPPRSPRRVIKGGGGQGGRALRTASASASGGGAAAAQ
jgi:hypothetical protein